MTFAQICDETWRYNDQECEPLLTKEDIALQLVEALNAGFATAISTDPMITCSACEAEGCELPAITIDIGGVGPLCSIHAAKFFPRWAAGHGVYP